MKVFVFLSVAATLLVSAFLIAAQKDSPTLWAVFAFLVIIITVVGLIIFGFISDATIKGFGLETTLRTGKEDPSNKQTQFAGQHSSTESAPKAQPAVPVACIEDNESLIVQDYYGLIEEFDAGEGALYREVTKRLREDSFPCSVPSGLTQGIGNAVYRWVAHGHHTIKSGYPGMANTPDKSTSVINRLHRAAYQHITSGNVLLLKNDDALKNACAQLAKEAGLWVQTELMERSMRGSDAPTHGKSSC